MHRSTFKSQQVSDNSYSMAGKIFRRAAWFENLESRRLLSASALDNTFDGDGLVTMHFGTFDLGTSVVVQPWDQKIVASVFSDAGQKLVRFNTDGSLDTTFGVSGVVDLGPHGCDFVVDIATAPGNKLVVLGDTFVNNTDFRVTRLDSSGATDPGFNGGLSRNIDVGTLTSDTSTAVAVRGDGSIVIAGTTNSDWVVWQLDSTGADDTGFGTSGFRVINIGPSAQCLNMTLQPNGSAVLVGQVINTQEDFAIARVDASGNLDTTFDTDGMLVVPDGGNSERLSGVVATNTDIFAVGEQGTQGVLLHFTAAGLDADFASLGDPLVEIVNTDDGGTNIAFDNSGKLLIIGQSSTGSFTFARHNTNGTADTAFDGGDGSVFGPFAPAINLAVQADGRVVIVGAIDNAGDFDLALARYDDGPTASLSGIVWLDGDNDGQVDFGETGILGVTVHVSGINELSEAVARSTVTDSDGAYVFLNLRPGTYTLSIDQPSGYTAGMISLGTAGGAISGGTFNGISLINYQDGFNYNFGQLAQSGAPVEPGQAAEVGFWQNRNGQNLIKSLNGGAAATALSNWLASNFPRMFGVLSGSNDLSGQTNAQVAAFYQQQFKLKGQKLDANVLATALSVYVTNSSLAGSAASAYGFTVSATGLGAATYNVGNNGAAFGVANGTTMSIMDLLLATDVQSVGGVLYGGNSGLRQMAFNVYSGINSGGSIG